MSKDIYTGESAATGWFVAIIVVLGLLAMAYLVMDIHSHAPQITHIEVGGQ